MTHPHVIQNLLAIKNLASYRNEQIDKDILLLVDEALEEINTEENIKPSEDEIN